MDRLRVSKVNYEIQRFFKLQIWGRKVMKALRANAAVSKHEKSIISQVQGKINQRIKVQVLAAFYDSSCETKLKVAGFLHYLAPKAANVIASYFQRWRDFQAEAL